MFRASSCPSSGATTTAVAASGLPSEVGDSSAVGRGRAGCIYVFCIYLRTNSDLCHLQHNLIGFYNRDEKCSERGTDWVFK